MVFVVNTVDGGNLAPLLQCRFLTAPYPLFNIAVESLQKQICFNDGNLAPPQTEQLPMLKRGCGDASSRHRRSLLCRWCKISSIHRLDVLGENIRCGLDVLGNAVSVCVIHVDRTTNASCQIYSLLDGSAGPCSWSEHRSGRRGFTFAF